MAKFTMTKQKFTNQWLQHFAKDIPDHMLKKYVDGQYIWHIFSYQLIKSDHLLIGDSARQAFDQASKENCICCDPFGPNGVTDKLSPQYNTAAKIDKATIELYIVAKDYSWTYIKTHEGDSCGPYFFRTT